MPHLILRDICIAFGGPRLLDNAQLTIDRGERICIIGRNGEGKTTLLKIIEGTVKPDAGEMERAPGLKVARLEQEMPDDVDGSVFEVVASGAGAAAKLLSTYHRTAIALGEDPLNPDLAQRIDELQHQLEETGGWAFEHTIERLLTQLELPADTPFSALSGGLKRRTLLARALACSPDILLLDEPTNHLDLPSIQWMETFLQRLDTAIVFVTHDRAFLRKLATRIVDLDRGQLTSWDCDYDTFLDRKAEWLEGQTKQQAVFDKKLAQEETWIRQGIKARRTRNEGRVRALERMRRERAKRREQQARSDVQLQSAEQGGAKVIDVRDASFAWEGHNTIRSFTSTIWRGDKIGIVGPNGSGKSTLLKLLLGELEPTHGSVTHGTRLETAYFDQHREQLDPNLSVAENVNPYRDTITVNGAQRHLLSYLQDFLFSAETARGPITGLSGGERARLLLARLLQKPANLLVLDEPTNDLDIETVELLEQRLVEFSGTILLVSHDRDFLENVVSSFFVLEGDGIVHEYAGGDQAWRKKLQPAESKPTPKPKPASTKPSREPKPRKMSRREREEFEAMPARIEKLESEHQAFVNEMAQPDFVQRTGTNPEQAAAKLSALEEQIAAAYSRWEELEALANS